MPAYYHVGGGGGCAGHVNVKKLRAKCVHFNRASTRSHAQTSVCGVSTHFASCQGIHELTQRWRPTHRGIEVKGRQSIHEFTRLRVNIGLEQAKQEESHEIVRS